MSGTATGHYLRPTKRASVPRVLLFVVCDTRAERPAGRRGLEVRHLERAHVGRLVRRRGSWSDLETYTVRGAGAARELVESLAHDDRRNWVITPSVQETLTLLEWWDHASAEGILWGGSRGGSARAGAVRPTDRAVTVRAAVLRGGFDLWEYERAGRLYRWVAAANYFPDGFGVGRAPRDGDARADGGVGDGAGHGGGGGAGRLAQLADRMRRLCDWWLSVARAPFGVSASGLAWGLLRSHASPKLLCTHQHEEAHALERSAAHGGRASCWYVGSIGNPPGRVPRHHDAEQGVTYRQLRGPLYHVDVRSMYPALLRDELYPVRLVGYRGDVRPGDLPDLCRGFGVIARVTIRTRAPEYPRRGPDRTTYPVGEFVTALAGPELLRAGEDGEILQCHAVAIYQTGRPFSAAMSVALDARRRAASAGDAPAEQFAKLCANALGGKLAQRAGGWSRAPERDEPGRWGEHWEIDARTGAKTRYRYLCGLCWAWVEDRTGRGPHTAAYAYLTSYGRLRMRAVRDALPARTVVSQDTDGLWLTQEGLDALAALDVPAGPDPGQLRVTRVVDDARFYGPRHYYAGGRWTLAGFSDPEVSADGTEVVDRVAVRLWGRRSSSAPDGWEVYKRTSHLLIDPPDGVIRPDGWITPAAA